MNTNIQVFDFKENVIRAKQDEKGNPLFVAKDVAKALGYADTDKAIRTHCKNLVKGGVETAGGLQEGIWIYEPDLYRLIFSSKLESAQAFQDVVFENMLPSIRKTGRYENVPADFSNHEARLSRLEQQLIATPRKPVARYNVAAPSVDTADIILATIRKHCAKAASDIKESILILCCKAYRSMDTDSRENIINALVSSGSIDVKNNEGKGRPGRKFTLKNKV